MKFLNDLKVFFRGALKSGELQDEKQIGVFAQDVQKVIPEAVKLAPFDRDETFTSVTTITLGSVLSCF